MTPKDQLLASHEEFRKLAQEHTQYAQRLESLTLKRAPAPPRLHYNSHYSQWLLTATITRWRWLALPRSWGGWLGRCGACPPACWLCSSCGFSAIRSGLFQSSPGRWSLPLTAKL